MIRAELGRVDCFLQVQPPFDMTEEDVERPLLLVVAPGCAPREPGPALAQSEARREGRPRAGARP